MARFNVIAAAMLVGLAHPIPAQELIPEFYAGVLGGLSPTYSQEARHWEDDHVFVSAGAFTGVNFRSESLLYGIEASVSTDFGKANQWEGFGWVPGAGQPSMSYSYYEVTARPALSGRLGASFENWTIFSKAGIGAALISTTTVSTTSTTDTSWTPTVNYGVGTEYNFGGYFVRGEIEMTQFGDTNINAVTRANLGAGVVF